MRAHIVENGVVVNTIEVDSLDFISGLVEAIDGGIGWLYDGVKFINPNLAAVDIEAEAAAARLRRNAALAASDWTQLADASVDNLAWAIYRQNLREVPQQSGFPSNIVWPAAPNGKPPNG